MEENRSMRVSVLLWKNQVFDFPESPRKKVPAELRIPETYNFVREVQCFFFLQDASRSKLRAEINRAFMGEHNVAA